MDANEQRLAMMLMAVLLIGGAFLGFKRMSLWKAELERRETAVGQRNAEAEALLSTKDMWDARTAWMDQQLRPWPGKTAANEALASTVDSTINEAGITLKTKQQQEPVVDEGMGLYSSISHVNAKGPMDKVLRWLHGLQKSPERFLSVSGMTIAPDLEDPQLVEVTDVVLQQWYRAPEAAPDSK